ncbi:hypothetical protein DUK53_16955 [Listeria sp. SHR_NRA_18]|uniref:hypothetical protein n=1 Tax=Listeria sp. SHR_NRA_18 TaxID=2269046 RepID=UPI000F5FDB4E|nr:hypothetical protein [Listeria sp. SHR_NRA_18]RQW65325.1 hypothetical protein DUK53_16955 [Listeria sp. SHR_NRA_18]
MVTYEEEKCRQEAQEAFVKLIQMESNKSLALRAVIHAFDQSHTALESLDMRLEALALGELADKSAEPLLRSKGSFVTTLACLARCGEAEQQQEYLDKELDIINEFQEQIKRDNPLFVGDVVEMKHCQATHFK